MRGVLDGPALLELSNEHLSIDREKELGTLLNVRTNLSAMDRRRKSRITKGDKRTELQCRGEG